MPHKGEEAFKKNFITNFSWMKKAQGNKISG